MMRFRHAAALLCALLGFAPAACAQDSSTVPLQTVVGAPVPFRVGLPKGWRMVPQEHGVMVERHPDVAVFVVAIDLLENPDGKPGDAKARRVMTSRILGSDSLLHALLRDVTPEMEGDSDLTYTIGTLAGQRAGIMRGSYVEEGVPGRFEIRATARDGIGYVAGFAVEGEAYATYEPLFARIRESLVFPSALAAAEAQR